MHPYDDPDLTSLVAAVEAEDRGVDLSGAVLRSGWENVVLETGDGWIYRFPRDGVDFDREMAILRRLSGRLPAPIPEVEWTGSRTRFAAYRALTGAAFTADAYEQASQDDRDRLARSLAAFLAAMHTSLSPAEVGELGIPHPEGACPTGGFAAEMDRIPPSARPAVEELLAEVGSTWERGAVPGPNVVLHNDFHPGNLVLDAPVGEVVGVWDFSNVQVGKPTTDLRYLVGEPMDLARRTAGEYERLSGNRVDLRAAVLASRMETVADQLEMGLEDRLPEVTERWRREDLRAET